MIVTKNFSYEQANDVKFIAVKYAYNGATKSTSKVQCKYWYTA